MSPTTAVSNSRVSVMFAPTVNAVDPDDILQHTEALGRRFPVQQDTVCFYASERNERREGDFEAEHLDELLYGLREDLIRAEGDPMACQHLCD